MAISRASRKGGGGKSGAERPTEPADAFDELEDDEEESKPTPKAGARVLPTRTASTQQAAKTSADTRKKQPGATHVLLTRARVAGVSYDPGDQVKLSPAEAKHLAEQGAVRAL